MSSLFPHNLLFLVRELAMPSGAKNTKFTNRHANEANSRKAEAALINQSQQAQAHDDESWRDDDDKVGQRKADRAAEKDEKDRQAKARKAERDAELDAEERSMEKKPPKAVTKKEQQRLMAAMARDYDMEARLSNTTEEDGALAKRHGKIAGEIKSEKVDKRVVDGNPNHPPTAGGDNAPVPTGVESALAKARIDDRVIGKRARVAYRKFESVNMEAMKSSKPGLRRTQYSDLMWTLWQKSPENPFVQRQVRRADEMLERKWCQNDEEPSSDEEGNEED
jgi:hypothetical protein